jgi:hypothetical protein
VVGHLQQIVVRRRPPRAIGLRHAASIACGTVVDVLSAVN